MTDEELRAAYMRAEKTERPSSRAGCPDPDAVIALVQRKGPEVTRLETLDHTMSCAACRREFELLRAIDAGEQREAKGDARARPARWHQPLMLALAASIVLAIGVGPGLDWWRERDATVTRGDAGSIIIVSPESDAALPAAPRRFVWRTVPGAGRYTVELLGADFSPRISETTADTSIVLSGVTDLATGEYRWWVRAELPGGERRSEVRTLRIQR